MLNALTIDVEGFVESNIESFHIPASHRNAALQDREIETNIKACLELLDSIGVRATFFILGRIARDLPDIVRSIARAGHEVGCHGFEHRRIHGLTPTEFARGLKEALDRLQDLSGTPVLGFRAPDFSITRQSLWALDVLVEAGFRYDSSVFPISGHDVYGIPGASSTIHRLACGLVEFPLSSYELLGRRFPFGGGGWFRLYPVALTRALMRRTNAAGHPCMFYIHPYELGPSIPSVPGLSILRRFRHYYNTTSGRERLLATLKGFSFGPAATVLAARGFL